MVEDVQEDVAEHLFIMKVDPSSFGVVLACCKL